MRRLSTLAVLFVLFGCDAAPVRDDGGRGGDAGAADAAAVDAATARDAGTGDAGAPADGSVADGSVADGSSPDAGGTDAGVGSARFDAVVARLADPTETAASLDALLTEVAWAEGWPLTDGARWLFATRWDAAPGAVSLVSGVNAWAPARGAATRAMDGVHYYVVLDESGFDVPATGAHYKWFAPAAVYRDPPEATAYGWDTLGPFGYVAPPTDAAWRERFPDFVSAHLDDRRAFRALLPAGFVRGSAAASHARVLFLHDGQNVFHPDAAYGGWRVDEAVAAAGYEDVVVLAVDNAPDRFDAYTHVVDEYSAGSRVGGRADDYLRLMADEALPFFRARYGVVARGDSLAVGGSSLGGLVSLYAALREPTLMGCVIAMSPTLGWGAFDPAASGADALVRQWTAHGPVAIYLDSGGGGTCSDPDGDGVQEDADDSDNYCTTGQLRDRLDTLGYAFDVDLFHWWTPGAGHNEAEWALRMPHALDSCAAAGWARP